MNNANALRQCAWCLVVVDTAGEYTIRASVKLARASHGICPPCKAVVRAQIEWRPRHDSQPYPR